MPRNGTKNLIPANMRTKEEVKKNSSKGGINSGITRRKQAEARKQARSLAEMLSVFVNAKAPIDPKKPKAIMEKMGIVDEEVTVLAMGCLNLAQRIAQGDLKSLELYNKLTEAQRVDLTTNGKEIKQEALSVHFVTTNKEYLDIMNEIQDRNEIDEED